MITIEHKFLSEYSNLDSQWFSGIIFLQSLNDREVAVVLQNVKASFQEICDRCGRSYLRNVQVQDYEIRYALDLSEMEKENDMMPINSHGMIIDLSEQVHQAFELQKPLVFFCDNCSNNVGQDEEVDYFESSTHVSIPF